MSFESNQEVDLTKAFRSVCDYVSKFSREKKKGPLFSPWTWFLSWSHESFGFLVVSRLLGRPLPWWSRLKMFLKGLALFAVGTSPELLLPKGEGSHSEVFILSWLLKGDVSQVLSGKDRYFGDLKNIRRPLRRILMCLYPPMQEEISELREHGAVLILWKRDPFRIFKAVFVVARDLLKGELAFGHIYFALNPRYVDGALIKDAVLRCLDHYASEKSILYMAYEAQPEQRRILDSVSKSMPSVVTVGYIHSSLMNLPFHYIYDGCGPKLLLVHGTEYPRILTTYCNWPKSQKILVTSSFRFKPKSKTDFECQIFLPYSIKDLDQIKELIVEYFASHSGVYAPYDVQIHPVQFPRHVNFQKTVLRELESNSSIHFYVGGARTPIFIGPGTSILEALEAGLECLHLCANPIFEIWSEEIWSNLEVKRIEEHVYSYRLKVPGSFIKYEGAEPLNDLRIDQHMSEL